jgi:predicted nuclease with TOPRIM domain
MEEQVHEAVGRTTEARESHRQEIQTGLREGLAGIQSAILGSATVSDSRLDAVEERLQRSDEEMSELGELHTALDVGLGALRSEIAEVRDAMRNESANQAYVEDLGGLDSVPSDAAPARDHGRGRKSARNADAGTRLAIAIEAAEVLAREHQELKAQVARIGQEADAASARASSQDSASGPLRSDVRLLQQQLAAQNESLATLSRAVERLRRKLTADSAPKLPRRPRKN